MPHCCPFTYFNNFEAGYRLGLKIKSVGIGLAYSNEQRIQLGNRVVSA